MMKHATPIARPGAQAGFTLVEMMVALTIGLVVVLGFTASFVNMKSTFNSQDQFSQLQDNERLALTILTTSVQEAGYYPDPRQPRSTQIPFTGPIDGKGANMIAGQTISGTMAIGVVPETLSTAYASASGDGLLTCQGGTNTLGLTIGIRNIFYVDTAQNALGCAVIANASITTPPGSGFVPLISGVSSMSVLYAVDSDGDTNIDQYLNADQVTTNSLWVGVKAVRITLNFINPSAAQTGVATIPWTQTINLMNNK